MIELKLSNVNKGVLLATSRYFSDLADAFPGAAAVDLRAATVAAPIVAPVTRTPGAELFIEKDIFGNEIDGDDEEQNPLAGLPFNAASVDDDDDDDDDDEWGAPIPPATNGAGSFVAAGVELDSDQLPWDHRIHASTKTKIGNGTWKLKPKTDPALIAQVRAEYKQAAAVPSNMTPPLLPQAAAVEPAPTQAAPAATTVPTLAPPPATAEKPTNPGLLFAATLRLYAEAQATGKIGAGAGDAWAKAAGLPSVASLITRPDLCGAFYDQLKAMTA